MDNCTQIKNLIFHDAEGNRIGLIAPSTFYCIYGGCTYINGPKKVIKLHEQTIEALTEGLRQSGSLIEGDHKDIEKLSSLLANPISSRTASFFMCANQNGKKIIDDFKSIENSNLLIVGCGGIGSTAALLLAGCGVKNITLVDSDIIEKSNLNRQLFWKLEDIKKPKVEVLKKAIEERFEDTSITTLQTHLDLNGLRQLVGKKKFSVVLVTADDPPTMSAQCADLVKHSETPFVSGGYLHGQCAVNFFPVSLHEELREIHPNASKWKKLNPSIMPSFGPTNMNIASLLASGAISFIANHSLPLKHHTSIQWNASIAPSSFRTFTDEKQH
ncbi:ThiF family adenylyltransferase [Pseudomonas sp. CHM02]|uniref:ThiF family adenylyltransferase n=1 Tax=Pseudomonas sp. CHM02 TaxID=1463662 RepID=UPI000AEBE2BE|nr:ThiF family adenylyltransferase [Pseudomonas sp. CHM02]